MKRVFLIDDDLALLRGLAKALARHFLIETASTVAAAIARLQSEPPFDAVICDYHLPDGTGLQVLPHAPNARRILHSAAPPVVEVKDNAVVEAILKKPTAPEKILKLLQKMGV